MASMTLLKAIEAGIDTVDTCLAPLALRTSQPAIEPLIVSLQNTQYQIDLDLNLINKIGQQLEKSLLKYRDYFDTDLILQRIEKQSGFKIELNGKIINKASDSAVRCMEIASGSPLTEEELNGSPNRECPSFWPSDATVE